MKRNYGLSAFAEKLKTGVWADNLFKISDEIEL